MHAMHDPSSDRRVVWVVRMPDRRYVRLVHVGGTRPPRYRPATPANPCRRRRPRVGDLPSGVMMGKRHPGSTATLGAPDTTSPPDDAKVTAMIHPSDPELARPLAVRG